MKVRKDFVTNSSSSSYIIGKKDDTTVTVDSVFRTIRDFYKEYIAKRNKVIKYLKNNPDTGIKYIKKRNGKHYYYTFEAIEGSLWDDKNRENSNNIENKFNIDLFDTYDTNYDWLNCNTYKEFENYWINRIKKKDCYYAPFTIADFSSDEVIWIHLGSCDKQKHEINSKAEVIYWYFTDIAEAFNDKSCTECEYQNKDEKEHCLMCETFYEDDPESVENWRKIIEKDNIPEDKACLFLLGKVCIYSEDGYIPLCVTEKLYEISEYACNHMG